MSLKNILVTGGAGYIGSHTCKRLSQAGYTPIAYDSLVNGHPWAVQWGPLEVGDICDRERLDQVIEEYQPEAVVHFAAFAYVGESVQHPAKYYRNNVMGSLTLLEAMVAHGIDKMVFSSTCATYGMPEEMPIVEATIQCPVNPYGYTKLAVEGMLKNFAAAYGMSSTCLRYFNAAGADPDNQIGEDHDPETHLIPLVLDAAIGRRESITVFGDDYPTPDGSCIRDYIHVMDLADAHLLALQKLEQGSGSNVFNLGNGKGFSVFDVVKVAQQVTGKEIKVDLGPRREGDPAQLVADASKAFNDLGWSPQLHQLETIIETAWRWTLKQDSAGIINQNAG